MKNLDRMVLAARANRPEWTAPRESAVLARVRLEQETRNTRKKQAIVGLSLVAAAALFCARAAAGGPDATHDATSNGSYAASSEALGLGDAGLVRD